MIISTRQSGTDTKKCPSVRPSRATKRRGQVRNEPARPHPENGRGRYATNTHTHPAGGVTPQPPGRGVFTYSASGAGDSRSRKKKCNSRLRRNQGAKVQKSVARETRAPKERGGMTAAKHRARERSEKCGKAERRTGAEPEAGTGGKPPNRAGPHRPDRDRKPEHSAGSGESPRATGRK